MPVSVCGEAASRPLEALVLAALGMTTLSMPASGILPIKAMFSQVDLHCVPVGAVGDPARRRLRPARGLLRPGRVSRGSLADRSAGGPIRQKRVNRPRASGHNLAALSVGLYPRSVAATSQR